jgi:glycolate oxidase FAD binding subunit
LAEQVRRATSRKTPLRIVGGDTKAFYGRRVGGEALLLADHRGVISYDPSELVIVARGGTPLAEIEARLVQGGQMLAFEPPRFGAASTIGGVVAAGLAGPRRPFSGGVRDCVLGATILDGQGRVLRFGGQVFKNVAGFDAFRLMAGAMGCLGVILEVSLRVAPRPARELAATLELPMEAARARLAEAMRKPSALSGAFHDGQRLHLRFCGGEAGVAEAARFWGGEDEALGAWDSIRDHAHPATAHAERLWRLSLPQTAPIPPCGDVLAWDWAGLQVWMTSGATPDTIWRAAADAGGHAALFRGARDGQEVFQPLAPALLALHQRLKAALDPVGVFNPGRMYGAL